MFAEEGEVSSAGNIPLRMLITRKPSLLNLHFWIALVAIHGLYAVISSPLNSNLVTSLKAPVACLAAIRGVRSLPNSEDVNQI